MPNKSYHHRSRNKYKKSFLGKEGKKGRNVMFEKYTDIYYKAGYDNDYNAPIHFTFKDAYISIIHMVGSRRILVGDSKGYAKIWISDEYGSKYFAFLYDVAVVGEPSCLLVNRVWKIISATSKKHSGKLKWTKENLNSMFERLYFSAKSGLWF